MQETLEELMQVLINGLNIQKLKYQIEGHRVTLDIQHDHFQAQKAAQKSAQNYWKGLHNIMKQRQYFEVSCTWIDKNKEKQLATVNSFNFPHLAGSYPRQVSFKPLKGKNR